MVYNQNLALRIRERLAGRAGYTEMKMFGGVGYLLNGNMACGVNQDTLIIRVGKENYHSCLEEPCVVEFDMTGRPMTGWVAVLPQGYLEDRDLDLWLERGINFAASLPPR